MGEVEMDDGTIGALLIQRGLSNQEARQGL